MFVFALVVLTMTLAPFVCDASAATREKQVTKLVYEVSRLHDTDREGYAITLHFKGNASGRSSLRKPGEWASAQHAERGIEALEVLTPGAHLEATDKPDVVRVVHRPGIALTVRYVLRQIDPLAPHADAPTHYLPVLQAGYFEWIGWTAWVFPENTSRHVAVTVSFENLPLDWNFASSFGLDPRHVAFEGSMDHFRSSIFVGGDFRLRSRAVRGGTLITAIRGTWAMRDGLLADRVAVIVDGERAFWRDTTQPYFLVTVTPLVAPPGWRSITGTGLSQSFAAFVSNGSALESLDFLWTHEYFHNWNNDALGKFEEPEARLYWFSEGFTDYYMDLLQLRWGRIDLGRYASIYDGKLKSLAESPYADLPNDDIAARFFTNRAVGKLPYLRGQLLAARWDAEIRAISHGRRSLDDVMRALHAEHRQGAQILDRRRIVDRVRAEGIVDPEGDFERQIERGETPLFPDGTLTSCIAINDVEEARFDWGFDFEATVGGKPISGVKIDGPAYAAGVRDGQWLRTAAEGRTRTSMVEVGVQDLPDETVRVLRYYPTGALLTRRSATIKPGLDERQRTDCLHALGAVSATK